MSKLNLSEEIKEILSEYHDEMVEEINEIGHNTIKQLTNETRRNAPKNTGKYKRHIAWTSRKENAIGDKKYIWYVKGKHYRLTHLLTDGHAKRNGGRVPGNPFLKNAVERAIAEYEKEVENLINKK